MEASGAAQQMVDNNILINQLQDMNKEVVTVPGDGHGLLHAVSESMKNEGIQEFTTEELSTILIAEVSSYIQYYIQYSDGRDIISDVDRYIRLKEYNNDTIDLVLAALCNALGIAAVIFHQVSSGVSVIAIGPGRPDVIFRCDIYLVLSGTGGGAHYSGVRKIEAAADSTIDTPNELRSKPEVFSPETLRPYPKAAPRKKTGGRKKRKSAILTDTPEKNAIEKEMMQKQKTVKCPKGVRRSLKSKTKKSRKPQKEIDSSEEEEWYCLVCVELYSNSRPRESWIQCVACKKWSHEDCTSVSRNDVYVCHNCDSDEDGDFF